MTWGFVAAAAVTVVGGAINANQQKQAAKGAANAQSAAAQAGISEQERQFLAIQEMLKPYISAGEGALGGQQALLGLSGADAQRKAVEDIQNSAQFQSLSQQGENALLQPQGRRAKA